MVIEILKNEIERFEKRTRFEKADKKKKEAFLKSLDESDKRIKKNEDSMRELKDAIKILEKEKKNV